MFKGALWTAASKRKQPKRPPTGQWRHKMQSIHTLEHSSATFFSHKKKWSTDAHYNVDRPWEHDAQWENTQCVFPWNEIPLKWNTHGDEVHLWLWRKVEMGRNCYWGRDLFLGWWECFVLATLRHKKLLGQGSDPSHSCNLCCSCGNTGSFNPLCRTGTEWIFTSRAAWAATLRCLTHWAKWELHVNPESSRNNDLSHIEEQYK